MVGCGTTGRAVASHDLGVIGDRYDRQVHQSGGGGPACRPAATAAKAAACLALVLAVPLAGAGTGGPTGWPAAAPGAPAGHRATGAYTDPAGGAPAGDSGGAARPSGTPEPWFAAPGAAPGYRGLGTLTAQHSGLRLGAVEAPRAPEAPEAPEVREATAGPSPDSDRGAGRGDVVSRTDAGDSQQWILRPAAGGEVVLQSVAAGPEGTRVLTAEAGGAVRLRHDRTPTGREDTGQRWILTDRTAAALRPDPVTGLWATAFRIRAHRRGGCLLDGGADRSPVVGPCADPRAWWTAQGFYGATGVTGATVGTPRGLR